MITVTPMVGTTEGLNTPVKNQNSHELSKQSGDVSGKWENVKGSKRSRTSPGQQGPQLKKITKITDYWLNKPIDTKNSFENLQIEESTIQTANEVTNPTHSKCPPIFVIGVENIQPLKAVLDVTAKDSYSFKILNNNEVRIQPFSFESYKPIVNILKEKKTEYYTYQCKQDRKFKVVLKNIHPSVDIDELKNEIESHGHKVVSIINIVQNLTRKPLPLFFVEIENNENNKKIYEIIHLQNTVVKFEAPRKKRDIPQCTRCQGFYHTKNYCNKRPTCVKCAGEHLTGDCQIKEKIPNVICANCGGNHPASYKGCEVRKQLQQKLFPKLREKKIEETQPRNTNTSKIKTNISYAQAAGGRNSNSAAPCDYQIKTNEQANSNLEGMMSQLLNRMDTMLNLLTALISKLA